MSFEQQQTSEREILNRLDLDKIRRTDWDERFFLQSYRELLEKLKSDPENKNKTLIAFFEDAFFRPRNRDYSQYEDAYNMPAWRSEIFLDIDDLKELTSSRLIGGGNTLFHEPSERFGSVTGRVEMIQYGPARLYNLEPNGFVFIPNEQFDECAALGSSAFSMCTAIIVKTKKGVFFSHVTTGAREVKNILEKLQNIFGEEQIINVVRPQWSEAGKIVESFEKQWRFLAEMKNIDERKHSYIAVDSDRPGNVADFSVLVTREGFSVIGRNVYPKGKRELDHSTTQEYKF